MAFALTEIRIAATSFLFVTALEMPANVILMDLRSARIPVQ